MTVSGQERWINTQLYHTHTHTQVKGSIPPALPWSCSPIFGVRTLDVLTLLQVRLQVHLEEWWAAGVVGATHRPVVAAALMVPVERGQNAETALKHRAESQIRRRATLPPGAARAELGTHKTGEAPSGLPPNAVLPLHYTTKNNTNPDHTPCGQL